MPLFRRRRERDAGPDTPPATTAAVDESVAPEPAADVAETTDTTDASGTTDTSDTTDTTDTSDTTAGGPPLLPDPVQDRPAPVGPVDAAGIPAHERAEHLDLGGLLIPAGDGALDGLEVQLQADETTGQVLAVLVLEGEEAAVELRAFAAPKRERLWHSLRPEIADGATNAGGQTAEAVGAWGVELLVQVPVVLPDGQQALQVSRIAGIDGPRWFLRATFLGRAAIEPETAGRLQSLVESIVVVRGDGPMAPRDPIPLTVPGQQPGDPLPLGESFREQVHGGADEVGEDGRAPLRPFERGPEITETR